MNYQIMPMMAEQIAGKAYVHYTAWRETYRGLMPNGYLDSRSLEQCVAFARSHPENTAVALADGRVVGFCSYTPQARPFAGRPETSEVMGLYVLRAYQRYGIGRALLEAGLARLPQREVVLFVLEGNERAIGFYRHMGFAFTGKELRQETDYGPLIELEMLLRRTEEMPYSIRV